MSEVESMYSYLDREDAQQYLYKASVSSARTDYYTVPPMEELEQFSASELRAVKDFRVGRSGYGEVRWLEDVDLRGIDLDKIIHMDRDTITVYDDQDATTEKPSIGNGLNKPALLTLFSVFSPSFDVNFEQAVRESIEESGAKFSSYNSLSGHLSFRVEHFTQYGVRDLAAPVAEEIVAPSRVVPERRLQSTKATVNFGAVVQCQGERVRLCLSTRIYREEL